MAAGFSLDSSADEARNPRDASMPEGARGGEEGKRENEREEERRPSNAGERATTPEVKHNSQRR